MADKKISALTAASTPLAGTEVLPIVQSGATVKVAVSDLTAGRTASVSGLTVSGLTASTALALDGSKNLVSVTNTGTGNNVLATSPVLTTPNIGVATASKINSSEASTGTIANGATATIFTLPEAGIYLVVVRQDGAGNGTIRASGIVTQGSSSNSTSVISGVACTLASGSNFDVTLTNLAGGDAVFRYSYTRLSS
jgi:hypothetical protein